MANRGTPTIFWVFIVTALLVAGLAAIVGFAIHDEVTGSESESRMAAEAACQEIEQLFPDDPERTDDQCREPESEDETDGQDETRNGEEPPPQ